MNRFYILFQLFLITSCSNYGQLQYITKLPKLLDENSGMVYSSKNSIWIIEDNGNKDNIYHVDFKGFILNSLEVKNAKNRDWEDLARDDKGNVYIGDFGNNNNTRKNLTIYKVPNPDIEPGDKINAEEIRFRYPEQKKFPPKKEKRFYDTEAFFYSNGYLYLITKNRSNPFSGNAFIYKVPAKEGSHEAELISTFETCDVWETCQITSADISPDGKTIVLLSYGKLWVITNFVLDNFMKGDIRVIDLGVRTQLESVCFMDNTTLLLSDEERKSTGRNLYSYQLQD